MRYLAETFALAALRRGRPVEQFLGPAGSPECPGIRYIEVRPTKAHYEIILHILEDVGHENFSDLIEFPSLEQGNEEAEFGRLVATRDDPLAALAAAEEVAGAVRGRWVNAGLVQDEYHDYVMAGRPRSSSPDGHPWLARGIGS
ncbi:hypothetical protein [Actinacidiphila rubida]|uniref:hypothetical protein n=1 Tax=Actinacidiphila rubida TaxID=310780 RepID=UPI000943416B|nr:hypothetical protein [Actinacidiphila rubida]